VKVPISNESLKQGILSLLPRKVKKNPHIVLHHQICVSHNKTQLGTLSFFFYHKALPFSPLIGYGLRSKPEWIPLIGGRAGRVWL